MGGASWHELIGLLQWPAMVATVYASWLVASTQPGRRRLGFWVFLVSNALWIAWGVPSGAPALVVLQLCLAVMNIRGARKNAAAEAEQQGAERVGAVRRPDAA